MSVEVGSKALGKQNLGGATPFPCLFCLLFSFALPSLIQTSGSPMEFLEASVSGVVGSGGGWCWRQESAGHRWGMELADPSWAVVPKSGRRS